MNTVKMLCVNMFDRTHQGVSDTLTGAQQLERFEVILKTEKTPQNITMYTTCSSE